MNDLNVMEEIMVSILTNKLGPASERSGERIRAAGILELEIEFIPSDEFDLLYTAKLYPAGLEVVPNKRAKNIRATSEIENLACVAPALAEPLLSFAEEQHEFRRMNFSKFAASRLRDSLNPSRPAPGKMDQIERFLADARHARDHIIRANLRLVISNAGKYCTSQYGFEDLFSDGTLALMEAVDKFDYQRGFRFSTYATHAIRRSFFRKIERKQKDRQRFAVTDPDVISLTPDDFEVDHDAPAKSQLIGKILSRLAEHLTERELHVIEGRFGLNGRSGPQTLVQLSGELGICKERVRQVEGQALKKLHELAIELSHSRPEDRVPVLA
jgi:RNA polymerase primary sigma factor